MRAGNPAVVTIGALIVVSALLGAVAGNERTQDAARPDPQLFVTGDRCLACHNTMVTPAGEDVSIGSDWRGSMMANSSRDPYWQASVRREVLDHPVAQAEIENECSKCHMPMARTEAVAAGGKGVVFDHLEGDSEEALAALAMDGVSCTLCHQIEPSNLGDPSSFTGNYVVDRTLVFGQRRVYGPFAVDSGHTTIMRSASQYRPTQSSHITTSELCATCHTLYTEALDAKGAVIGRLPEQMPFQEWKHSAYVNERSCQSCHMPVVTDSVAVTGVLGSRREDVSRHTFRGGNFFMQRMLNRFRIALGVRTPSMDLDAAARGTIELLQRETAKIEVASARLGDGVIMADVKVSNATGHKLPTGYPSRRVWLHVSIRDARDRPVFESGALNRDGSIVGNDNDAAASAYEPHHTTIERQDQVQIFESVMAGPDGSVTTGLLTAVRFIKDNRLLPRGFDKATAHPDIAVIGGASADADFTGESDRVQYRIAVDPARGPFRIRAELMYQPIGFRWANNLAETRSKETDRFVGYYRQMAQGSATSLAATERVVQD